MDWIGLLERIFYATHAKCDVVAYLRATAHLCPGDRVLDFGGGTGRLSVALASTVPGLYVVADPARDALARVPQNPLVHPVCIPRTPGLPFRDGRFRHVFLVDVLHHVDDPVGSLVECLRCLSPGGSLHLVEYDARAQLPRAFNGLIHWTHRSCRFWTAEQLLVELERLGMPARSKPLDALRYAVRATKPSLGGACPAPERNPNPASNDNRPVVTAGGACRGGGVLRSRCGRG